MPTWRDRFRDIYDAMPWRNRVATNEQIITADGPLPKDRPPDYQWDAPLNGRVTPRTDLTRGPAPPNLATREARPRQPLIDGREFGSSGTENFGGYIRKEDFNPDLDDFRQAVVIYDKMKRGDAQIRSMLSVLKLPLRGATWAALPPEAGDPVDEAIAQFVNACLFEDDAMEFSWDFTLRHILLQLEYGFSVLEKVWRVDEDGHYRFLRLAPRLAKTILMWHVDRHGRLRAVVQWAPVPTSTESGGNRSRLTGMTAATPSGQTAPTLPIRYMTTVAYQELTIPAEYCAVFTMDREGDNYEGIPVLRNIYRNWFYKDQAYHLEGVRLDRWGVGIPVAQLQEGHTLSQTDINNLVEVLKKVRANERAFLIAPPNVSYELMPKSGGHSAGSGAMEWINHHDAQIARNVLAGFLTMGQDPHGTLGFGSRLTDMFVSSLNGVAQGIAGDLKHQVVRQLCDLNFDMTKRKYPRITCRDLEQVDMKNLVESLAVLAQTYIQPDDDTEKLLRRMLQLPPLKHEMTREAKQKAPAGTNAEAAAQPGQSGQPGAPGGAEGGAAAVAAVQQGPDTPGAAPAPVPHPRWRNDPNLSDQPESEYDLRTDAVGRYRGLTDRLDALDDRIDQIHPVQVTVHPADIHVDAPDIHVDAPHVETHLTLPKATGTKVIEHDTDPSSPTYGSIKSVKDIDGEN